MKTTAFPYQQFRQFSNTLVSYANHKTDLAAFYEAFPDEKGFQQALNRKETSYNLSIRKTVKEQLDRQHQNLTLHPAQIKNLESFGSGKTFSVSCGHQLVLGGGPAYFAYKILTTVKLAEELAHKYPGYQFVPVFWMASEDHDVEEISAFSFFHQSQKINVTGQGAVGRISTTGIADQLAAIRDFPEPMTAAFQKQPDMKSAFRQWMQHYFGHLGLLVLDADSYELKKEFTPVLLHELESDETQKRIVDTSAALEAAGYKQQIHPRNLNLFYLKNDERIRLERTTEGIRTIDGRFSWTMDHALAHFGAHPEELSPNVCLRPLYSQQLLPDVAFVGGPAEIAYWLQLKSVFDLHQTPFPLLIPRFSALYISSNQYKKMEKLGLDFADLPKDETTLRKQLVKPQSEFQLPDLEKSYHALIDWAQQTDPTLVPAAKAEFSKMHKMAESLVKRIQKAAEAREEQKLKQLTQLWEKFFPNDGLQERAESWLTFQTSDTGWLDKIYTVINPLDFRFQVLVEE